MGVADNVFSDEEKKYFESRGQDLPEAGMAEEQGGEGESLSELDRASDNEPKPSERVNEPADERYDEEPHQGKDDDSNEDERDREPSTEDKPARDFEKAYHSERHKRAEMKERLAQLERQNQEIINYVQQMQSQSQSQNQEQIPNPEEDPLGYSQYKIKELEQKTKQYDDYINKINQKQQHDDTYNNFVNYYKEQGRQFAAENPDFGEVYGDYIERRSRALTAAGYSQQEAISAIQNEELNLAARAYERGMNPAECLYNSLRAEGFAPKPKPKPKLERVEKGLKTSKRLPSSTSSNSIHDRFDMNRIDEMSSKEFDDYFNHLRAQNRGTRNW